ATNFRHLRPFFGGEEEGEDEEEEDDERLQADRMSRFKTKGHARGGLPARRPTTGGIVRRSGVQAKAGDDGESVTAPNIHRDPFPASTTTVGSQIVRAQRGPNKAGASQSIGNSA